MSETQYCPRHPSNETNLRCGKCDTLVCPSCLVHTPVGVRCPDCAQVRRLPTFDVRGPTLARAAGVGLMVAVAGGFALVFLARLLFLVPYLPFLALAGLGYGIGAAISASVNRRRGKTLKLVAAGATLIAYSLIALLSPQFEGASLSLVGIVAAVAAFYLAISRF